jgi:Nuclease A inhibitor-like protein
MAKQTPHPVLNALAAAVKGLLYISESEAPIEAVLLDDLSEVEGVEPAPLASFFRTVSKEDKPKYAKLEAALKQLTGVKVYKVGNEAEKTVYIVGKTSDGKYAGVKTSAVET